MSIRTRALVFSTFFGSCIAIGLLLVSLTTNHWVRASAKRLNSSGMLSAFVQVTRLYTISYYMTLYFSLLKDSYGSVNYGLFSGNKDLNVGYGSRITPVNVYTLITSEPDFMNFWLWLITALGTGFGLLSCAIAAIASVLKAASASKKSGTMALLFVSNISSASAQILAFICWMIQFYQYLTHNVLAEDDHNSNWNSRGNASFGFSFYLLIISIIVVLINIVVLIYAKRREHRENRRLEPPSEEKNQSAIMLY